MTSLASGVSTTQSNSAKIRDAFVSYNRDPPTHPWRSKDEEVDDDDDDELLLPAAVESAKTNPDVG